MSTKKDWVEGNPELISAREALAVADAEEIPWNADPTTYIKACEDKKLRVDEAKEKARGVESRLADQFETAQGVLDQRRGHHRG